MSSQNFLDMHAEMIDREQAVSDSVRSVQIIQSDNSQKNKLPSHCDTASNVEGIINSRPLLHNRFKRCLQLVFFSISVKQFFILQRVWFLQCRNKSSNSSNIKN